MQKQPLLRWKWHKCISSQRPSQQAELFAHLAHHVACGWNWQVVRRPWVGRDLVSYHGRPCLPPHPPSRAARSHGTRASANGTRDWLGAAINTITNGTRSSCLGQGTAHGPKFDAPSPPYGRRTTLESLSRHGNQSSERCRKSTPRNRTHARGLAQRRHQVQQSVRRLLSRPVARLLVNFRRFIHQRRVRRRWSVRANSRGVSKPASHFRAVGPSSIR